MCSVATLTIFLLVLCWLKTETVGLPLPRQELGLSKAAERDDIIAGADFLSVLMRSSDAGDQQVHQQQKDKPLFEAEEGTTPSAYDVSMYETDRGAFTPVIRGSRSSNDFREEDEELALSEDLDTEFGKKTSRQSVVSDSSFRNNVDNNNQRSDSNINSNNKFISEQNLPQKSTENSESNENSDKPRVIEIRVSSSVGKSLINKRVEYVPTSSTSFYTTASTAPTLILEEESTTTNEQTTPLPTEAMEKPTTLPQEQLIPQEVEEPQQHLEETLLVSEDHPSLIAEVNKSEFSIEESEPITRNAYPNSPHQSEQQGGSNTQEYPARVRSIPSLQNYANIPGANPDYLAQQLARQKPPKLQPYHQTVVYHNSNTNSRDPNRARSVSYSTVIQSVPHQNIPKHWADAQKVQEQTKLMQEAPQHQVAPPQGAVAESKDYYVTSKYSPNPTDYNESLEKRSKAHNWEKPEVVETTSKRHQEPTERNWGIPEKRYGMQSKPYRLEPQQPQAHKSIHQQQYHRPEQNYEVDESVSVVSNGRAHGVQPSPTVATVQDPHLKNGATAQDGQQGGAQGANPQDQKVGYVVEGRNFRKYRVEERTSDGFIVGEYGVVSHDDGSLRGVRYTADGTISPRLIYDALMKFLSL